MDPPVDETLWRADIQAVTDVAPPNKVILDIWEAEAMSLDITNHARIGFDSFINVASPYELMEEVVMFTNSHDITLSLFDGDIDRLQMMSRIIARHNHLKHLEVSFENAGAQEWDTLFSTMHASSLQSIKIVHKTLLSSMSTLRDIVNRICSCSTLISVDLQIDIPVENYIKCFKILNENHSKITDFGLRSIHHYDAFDGCNECHDFTEVIRRNFYLTTCGDFFVCADDRKCRHYRAEVEALLFLNQNGRRYLWEDKNNRLRGIEVLEACRDNLDALYVHLRENPGLCL